LAAERVAKPEITRATRPLTIEVESINEHGEAESTPIAGEHPLTIYLDKREIVTLMTLGQNPEALVLGYLRNQRLVPSVEHIAAVQVDWETDSAAVTTRKRVKNLTQKMSKRTVTTGCGQGTVFGDLMDSLETIRLPADMRVSEAAVHGVMEQVRRHESIYKVAGAVHGCALCTNPADGEAPRILAFVEDVGRHNAVDAIAGWMWVEGVAPLSGSVLLVSGRASFELTQKAVMAGVPILAAVSAPSSLAVDLAAESGMTLVAFLRGESMNVYSRGDRIT